MRGLLFFQGVYHISSYISITYFLTNEMNSYKCFLVNLFFVLFILLIKNYKYIVDEDYVDIKNSLLLSFSTIITNSFLYT